MFQHGLLAAALATSLTVSMALPVLADEIVFPSAPGCYRSFWKVAVPTTVKKKNHRICYDCKEEDYAHTRCLPTPIPSHQCPNGGCEHFGLFGWMGKCGWGESLGCVHCGKPHTRKVLIKKIITEEAEVPACKVERIPDQLRCGPAQKK